MTIKNRIDKINALYATKEKLRAESVHDARLANAVDDLKNELADAWPLMNQVLTEIEAQIKNDPGSLSFRLLVAFDSLRELSSDDR